MSHSIVRCRWYKMTTRALTFLLRRNINKIQIRSAHHDIPPKHGNREILCAGPNNAPDYLDSFMYPMPAIRYKEVTPDIQALREKEKGDWKKLSIEEKKMLYRASFRQTFAEMEAPLHDWKGVVGLSLVAVTIAIWIVIFTKKFVSPPLPDSFSEEHQLKQLEMMRILDVRPISGLPK